MNRKFFKAIPIVWALASQHAVANPSSAILDAPPAGDMMNVYMKQLQTLLKKNFEIRIVTEPTCDAYHVGDFVMQTQIGEDEFKTTATYDTVKAVEKGQSRTPAAIFTTLDNDTTLSEPVRAQVTEKLNFIAARFMQNYVNSCPAAIY